MPLHYYCQVGSHQTRWHETSFFFFFLYIRTTNGLVITKSYFFASSASCLATVLYTPKDVLWTPHPTFSLSTWLLKRQFIQLGCQRAPWHRGSQRGIGVHIARGCSDKSTFFITVGVNKYKTAASLFQNIGGTCAIGARMHVFQALHSMCRINLAALLCSVKAIGSDQTSCTISLLWLENLQDPAVVSSCQGGRLLPSCGWNNATLAHLLTEIARWWLPKSEPTRSHA